MSEKPFGPEHAPYDSVPANRAYSAYRLALFPVEFYLGNSALKRLADEHLSLGDFDFLQIVPADLEAMANLNEEVISLINKLKSDGLSTEDILEQIFALLKNHQVLSRIHRIPPKLA